MLKLYFYTQILITPTCFALSSGSSLYQYSRYRKHGFFSYLHYFHICFLYISTTHI